MSLSLIDSHCHLDDDRFDDDRDAVIRRAASAGVDTIVIPATTAQRWPKVRRVAALDPRFYPAYGLHPWFMPEHRAEDIALLDEWLAQNPATALGECGLDFYASDADRPAQLQLFRDQLALAASHRLPVIIHARKALDDVLRELRACRLEQGGVVHSFSGSLQQAQQLVDLGFKLGIAATVSYERARRLREVVAHIDLEALLLESDAPDQPGAAHRGQRNEPAFIQDHLRDMACLRQMVDAELAQHLNRNCRELFALANDS